MKLKRKILVGTYTVPILFGTGEIFKGDGKGIYTYSLENGFLILQEEPVWAENPSYLTVNRSRTMLYAVNELKEYQGQAGGAISCFSFHPETNKIVFQKSFFTGGGDPCFVAEDPQNGLVYVCNYAGGSLAVFPQENTGMLKECSQLISYSGSGGDPFRQSVPHVHSVFFSLDGNYVFVVDLGTDNIRCYRVTGKEKILLKTDGGAVFRPGSGPRCGIFHPNGKFCYVVHELLSTVSALEYCKESGKLTEFQTISTLPQDFCGSSTAAEIGILPNGNFLYVSNRGDDSIAIYKVKDLLIKVK